MKEASGLLLRIGGARPMEVVSDVSRIGWKAVDAGLARRARPGRPSLNPPVG